VDLVQLGESLKSKGQQRIEGIANRIVPFNLLYAGVVFAITRSSALLSAALMVDYSCALKLTGSVTALAAMRQAALAGLRVKGSRSFETMTAADVLIFDKTGTLTQATPRVMGIIGMEGWEETEVLRLAACLEEHFPHPVARAVVREATLRGIDHRERHADVEYLVAHGIASALDGRRVLIGSGHFVFDDEGVTRDDAEVSAIERDAHGASPLYLAVDGDLVGIILIEDPLKDGVAHVLDDLRRAGFERIVMLTGDNVTTARSIADAAGITEFEADLLPEQKRGYVEGLRESGACVVMVGDGVNDSPALAAADLGIAMNDGAPIAREVADVTLADSDLEKLLLLRGLSERHFVRMNTNCGISIVVNTALLLLGTAGLITPAISSIIHNATTVALGVNGMRRI
jgi:P-type E1-E2 ATPase